MKKYLIIKLFGSINSTHVYESLDSEEDALAMRDILQKNEKSSNVTYHVFKLVG